MRQDDSHTEDEDSPEPSVQFVLQGLSREVVSEHRAEEGQSADHSLRLGDLCAEEDDWIGALKHYRAAEAQGSTASDLPVKIACALDAIGEEEEAFAAFVAAYEKNPDPQTALSASDAAASAGDWNLAEEWANRAIAHDPAAKFPWYKLSVVFLHSGRPRAAAGAAGKASGCDPADPDLAFHWGELALDTGDLASAEAAFKRCLEASPTNHEAMTLLGIASWRAHKSEEGMRSVRLAMELEPEPRLAPGILAVMLRALGHDEDAEIEEQKVDALGRYDQEQLARLKQRLLERA